jgi:hypothetical protein
MQPYIRKLNDPDLKPSIMSTTAAVVRIPARSAIHSLGNIVLTYKKVTDASVQAGYIMLLPLDLLEIGQSSLETGIEDSFL